jgi:hypothetical protein
MKNVFTFRPTARATLVYVNPLETEPMLQQVSPGHLLFQRGQAAIPLHSSHTRLLKSVG